MQRKKVLGERVIRLLKQGYTPTEITQRMAVSYNYAWKLWKDMRDQAAAEDDDNVVRPRIVGPHEVRRVTKAQADEAKAEAKAAAEAEAEAKTKEVDNILDARADQYGSFMQSAEVAIKIKSIMHNSIARKDMHLFPDQMLALDMIAVKLSRIVGGNPAHRDSWLDIAGYAKLVADRLGGVSR